MQNHGDSLLPVSLAHSDPQELSLVARTRRLILQSSKREVTICGKVVFLHLADISAKITFDQNLAICLSVRVLAIDHHRSLVVNSKDQSAKMALFTSKT